VFKLYVYAPITYGSEFRQFFLYIKYSIVDKESNGLSGTNPQPRCRYGTCFELWAKILSC